jgi:hypothetical protein
MVPAPVFDTNGAAPSGTDSFTLAIGATPSATIVRDVGGILVEMRAGHFNLDGNAGGATFYFESSDCTGVAHLPSGGSGGFYPTSVRVGSDLLYASAPPVPITSNSNKNTNPGSSCIVGVEGPTPMSPVASLDLAQFPAPYFLE